MSEQRHTPGGTPCADSWDADWVAQVTAVEEKLDRRICGARCLDGTPCPRTSDHDSGRCAHHGGHPLAGAPKGNVNARIHGLYAMRLQVCGPHCARWDSCPYAQEDLLELPAGQRPNCPFEQEEFDLLTHSEDDDSKDSPEIVALRHTTALLQVMVGRAAAAMAVQPLTDQTRASTERYSMESTKPSAALDAFLRLAREHRRSARELARLAPPEEPKQPAPLSYPDKMKPILQKLDRMLPGLRDSPQIGKIFRGISANIARKKLEEVGLTVDDIKYVLERVTMDALDDPNHPGAPVQPGATDTYVPPPPIGDDGFPTDVYPGPGP